MLRNVGISSCFVKCCCLRKYFDDSRWHLCQSVSKCSMCHDCVQKTATAVAHCKQGNGLIKVNGRPLDLVEPVILRAKVCGIKWLCFWYSDCSSTNSSCTLRAVVTVSVYFICLTQTCLPLWFCRNSYGFRPQILLLYWLGQKLRSLSDFSFPAF